MQVRELTRLFALRSLFLRLRTMSLYRPSRKGFRGFEKVFITDFPGCVRLKYVDAF